MPHWTASPEWQGQEAFLLGGGDSLSKFDLNLLKGKNVIGCNEAFTLGPEIVHTVLFTDARWWQRRKFELEDFGGRIVSICSQLLPYNLPNYCLMDHKQSGFATGHHVALNFSTGAAAINLAVNLGARKIFLLGYDLNLSKQGRSHWHNRYQKTSTETTFKRHYKGFVELSKHLKKLPEVEVVNVTDGSSRIDLFPKISYEDLTKHLHGHHNDNETPEGGLLEEVKHAD